MTYRPTYYPWCVIRPHWNYFVISRQSPVDRSLRGARHNRASSVRQKPAPFALNLMGQCRYASVSSIVSLLLICLFHKKLPCDLLAMSGSRKGPKKDALHSLVNKFDWAGLSLIITQTHNLRPQQFLSPLNIRRSFPIAGNSLYLIRTWRTDRYLTTLLWPTRSKKTHNHELLGDFFRLVQRVNFGNYFRFPVYANIWIGNFEWMEARRLSCLCRWCIFWIFRGASLGNNCVKAQKLICQCWQVRAVSEILRRKCSPSRKKHFLRRAIRPLSVDLSKHIVNNTHLMTPRTYLLHFLILVF